MSAPCVWFPFSASVGHTPYGLTEDLLTLGPVGHVKKSIIPGLIHHKPANICMLHLPFGAHDKGSPDGKSLRTDGWALLQCDPDLPKPVRDWDEWALAFFLIKAALPPKCVLVFYTGNPDASPVSTLSLKDIMGPAQFHCRGLCFDGSGGYGPDSLSFALAAVIFNQGVRIFTEAAPLHACWNPYLSGSFSYQSAIANMQRDGWTSPVPTKAHYLLMKDTHEPITVQPLPHMQSCIPGWLPSLPSHPDGN